MRRIIIAGLAALLPLAAIAQDAYPQRPVRMVVAFAPGGSIDIVARIIAQDLTRSLGQPVVVENRPGASGNLGADFVAKAAADGHTLFMGSASSLAANAALFRNLPYDPLRDFAPITLVALQPNVVVVHPSVPVRSIAELIAYARAHPGRLNYGSAGSGSSQQMAADVFRRMNGIEMVHVPYRGGAPALSDLMAGQIQVMFETIPTAIEPVLAGQLRALAVTIDERATRLPEVPTMAEAGLPGYRSRGWIGLVARAGTDLATIATLARHGRAAIATPQTRDRLLALGLEVRGTAPEEFAAFMREEVEEYRRIVTAMGIQLD
ncbi:Bug family tripartite tricarboxylate transporter substrate binding protein [Plastoroseomonas arctica]|uniref:Tripartite tricarboxylate transporter substrate binding protein n=1 Tax=Plastoroseomonas arctica TaxID=1509237 RepID=A0AAF1K096_9PROT|nr:tripartite tricarboxylate transporter substrate binding protein [Plastoroseomonas arctica]MBR0654579.1 tripartite tricarboxylate transporter substrate binding protein [Plastoroseomonas arctica]